MLAVVHMTQVDMAAGRVLPDEIGTCRTARCHRCGAALARVCADASPPNAWLRHTLDRWVGELSQADSLCGRCCELLPRRP